MPARSGRPAVILVLVAVAEGGCGGGGDDVRPPEGRATSAALADARAPDRVGALVGVGRGGTFTCRTGGAVSVRLAGADGVTFTARGRPLAYGGPSALLVRRDCQRIARAPHPFSRLAGWRWRGPRLTVTWRGGALRCRTAASVDVSLVRATQEEGAGLGAGSPDAQTEAFVLDGPSGRLVALAWVASRGSRVVSVPACRPSRAP